MKIFCIGTWKTGTTSIGNAISILTNGSHVNWKNGKNAIDLYLSNKTDEVFKIANNYDSFDDAPWNCYGIWQKLYKHFAESKFILSIRDDEEWFDSMTRWYFGNLEKRKSKIDLVKLYYLQLHPYGFNVHKMKELDKSKKDWIEWYNIRNNNILNTIPKERLLIMDASDGWKPICNFLEVSVPSYHFPHLNKN